MRYTINPDGTIRTPNDNENSSRTASVQQKKQRGRRRKGKPTTICPICQVPVRTNHLEDHKLKAHGIAESPSGESLTASQPLPENSEPDPLTTDSMGTKTARQLTTCPICNVTVRFDRLERHKRRVHHHHPPAVIRKPKSLTPHAITEPPKRSTPLPLNHHQDPNLLDKKREEVIQMVKAAHQKGEIPNLNGINLSGVPLHGLHLNGVYLIGADLREANLRRTSLRGAYLTKADLSGANLNQADLTGANLTRANLANANLNRAILTETNLHETNLTGVDLQKTVNLEQAIRNEVDLARINKLKEKQNKKRLKSSKEALSQSNYEPRDGSKGLGHMRRDYNGTFGSFPLHDDYDDEAGSD